MIPLIKSEFRKLLTVRSTYLIALIALGLDTLFAFYAKGWKAQAELLKSPTYLSDQVFIAVGLLSLLAAIVAVMLITHEYRYNTIMYTLTSSKTRTRVFFSKLFVISVFATVFGLFFGWLAPLLTATGLHVHGLHAVGQHFDVWTLTWHAAFAAWAFVMLVSIMALIIRIQVGAMAALFLMPGTVEALLGLLLKKNQVYLPFSSLNILLDSSGHTQISVARAATVAMAYIVGGTIIAWVLFVRRDAN